MAMASGPVKSANKAPGLPAFNPGAGADALAKAVQGWGTDEAAVWRELSRVRSQRDWDLLQRAFRDRHQKIHGGSLKKALDDDLTKDELVRAKGILRRSGVSWDGQPTQPPPGSASKGSRAAPGGYASSAAPPPPLPPRHDSGYRGRDDYSARRGGGQPPISQGFDIHDRAPEDRVDAVEKNCRATDWLKDVRLCGFDPYDHLVRGSIVIEGVNYAKYEQHRDVAEARRRDFINAIKDDMISEVGNGVRREDVALRLTPGQIKAVVLHYGDGASQSVASPSLVDAEWCIKVDYAIRARDQQRQRNIGMSLYTSFTSRSGFQGLALKTAYSAALGAGTSTQAITVRCPEAEEHEKQKEEYVDDYYPPVAVQAPPPPPPLPPPPAMIAPAPVSYAPRQQYAQIEAAPAAPPPYHHPAYGSNAPVQYVQLAAPPPRSPSPRMDEASTTANTLAQREMQLANLSREIEEERRQIRERMSVPAGGLQAASPHQIASGPPMIAAAPISSGAFQMPHFRRGLSPPRKVPAGGNVRRGIHSPRHAPQAPSVGTRVGGGLPIGVRETAGSGVLSPRAPAVTTRSNVPNPFWAEGSEGGGSFHTHEF
eukprot:Hpha_TRINITY_DN15517_c1_g1::TRINITY_DN15517_c1_g1_i1::g.107113::m.107113